MNVLENSLAINTKQNKSKGSLQKAHNFSSSFISIYSRYHPHRTYKINKIGKWEDFLIIFHSSHILDIAWIQFHLQRALFWCRSSSLRSFLLLKFLSLISRSSIFRIKWEKAERKEINMFSCQIVLGNSSTRVFQGEVGC